MNMKLFITGVIICFILFVESAAADSSQVSTEQADEILRISPEDSTLLARLDSLFNCGTSAQYVRQLVKDSQYAEAGLLALESMGTLWGRYGFSHFRGDEFYPVWTEAMWFGGDEAKARCGELAQFRVKVQEQIHGVNSPEAAASLISLAVYHKMRREYAEAEACLLRARSIREQLEGADQLGVAEVLDFLGWVNQDQQKLDYYRQALEIREKVAGPNDRLVGVSLMNIAWVLYGRAWDDQDSPLLDTVGQHFMRAMAIFEQAPDATPSELSDCLRGMGNVMQIRGNLDKAKTLFLRAAEVLESEFGADHLYVSVPLRRIAMIHNFMGQHRQEEPIWRRIVAIEEDYFGEDHPDLARSLDGLGLCLKSMGRYDEAEQIIQREVAVWEKYYGPVSNRVAMSLTNLAATLGRQGRYAEAGNLYRRIVSIWEQTLPEGHGNFGVAFINLASFCNRLGQYSEAEQLLEQALANTVNKDGDRASDRLALCLRGLGQVCAYQNRPAEAESLYQRALTVDEEIYGQVHPEVAQDLTVLANRYLTDGKYEEAEQADLRALAILEELLGANHPDIPRCLDGLAEVSIARGEYSRADSLYQRSLQIISTALGTNHPQYADFLRHCAELHRLRHETDTSLKMIEQAASIMRKNLRDDASVLSESDALAYAGNLRRASDDFITCFLESGPSQTYWATSACDIILSDKGEVSDEIFERRRGLVSETDSATAALAESLRLSKFQLSQLFVKGAGDDIDSYRSSVDSLGQLVNELETQLAQHSASFRRSQEIKSISLDRIEGLLPVNAALLEFIKFGYQRFRPDKVFTDPVEHYLVTVICKGIQPAIIDLGEASEIDALVERYRSHMLEVSSSGQEPSIVDDKKYSEICRALYEKIWQPVEQQLHDKQMVFVAPDGALNMLSFGGLFDDDGQYLIEKLAIHYLSAGRDLIRLEYRSAPTSGLLALGDPDYNATVASRLAEPETPPDTTSEPVYYASTRNIRSGCGELREFSVSSLPGTRSEVEQIAAVWSAHQNEPLVTYFGSEASEEKFKAEAPGKRVIHIATHGFFLEGACQSGIRHETGLVGENPLLLSGLCFAGANLHGEGCEQEGAEDGILTAYEVSEMVLDGTELVVLSACETGLGEVQEGEGVYGLRRAFQMAGARTVVSALWPVSDKVTAEMMGRLYERSDETIPDRMRRIQLEKIQELRDRGKADHPFSWGAFIALWDWR
ncbi:MAG: CHAT domain-containing protein [Candidatus Zixiibacteriota bacterium]|nr:MAG: CHAT domain-containing protein [candidate division Zixibacteria bacterium]